MLAVVFSLTLQLAAPIAASVPRPAVNSSLTPSGVGSLAVSSAADTTPRRRPHAVEYSDWYARRLTIHKIGAFASLPLYPTEYFLGDHLQKGVNISSWEKPTHVAVATAIGGIFAVNTVTGLWNLWDSRSDPAGRTRRIVHSVTMLASDAGFLATAAVAGDANEGEGNANLHRNLAISSMAVGAAGTVLMWLWKD